eukprot:Gregarina_sp_Poly_1__7353@NODE_405_length_8833_cov_93_710929_g329_i0_p8_GENE_NODE_405_length_8833_cov_93_710929_g329_i0NODE_405_length_8833_cov_93_710929_g329_i0_p8_ORF_typecomplete_len116_score14_79Myosin_tail_1/PF01576_19/0_0011Filament/PF00038_21/0_0044BRE1/PF08647_11/0_021HBD/PF18534_1/0_37HBD/PF18534_1/58Luteo_P1P2/PF08467_10/0_06Atg14/PF10186_9/0_062Spc7/PF08317_11/0_077Dynactin_p22/PF07426_11/1_5Dynactin_p22/PF07426_11/78CENPH/PF05837_12/0_77SPICE/PF15678_5/1_5IFT20/PF14931_6/2_4e02IFT20/
MYQYIAVLDELQQKLNDLTERRVRQDASIQQLLRRRAEINEKRIGCLNTISSLVRNIQETNRGIEKEKLQARQLRSQLSGLKELQDLHCSSRVTFATAIAEYVKVTNTIISRKCL